MKAADERDDGGFAGAGGADEGCDGAGFGLEADAVENGFPGLVIEGDIVEGDVAVDARQDDGAVRLAVLLAFVEDLGSTIETGERLGQLSTDETS